MVSIKCDYPISLLPRYYSLEFHPWEVNLAQLNTISKDLLQNATAIGEIGLDALKGPTLDIQLAVFNKLLEIANNLNKVVIIHNVGCTGLLFDTLAKYPKLKVIIHGFIGKETRLKEYLKRKFYVSLHPLAVEKYNLKEAIKNNIEYIGFETDDNKDISIDEVIKKSSILLDIPNLEEITNQNFYKLFNIKKEDTKK